MITAHELTKQYGDRLAVDAVSFSITPGQVTGFLGPNGAGKSTTMRLLMGLESPTSGSITVGGRPFREHASPLSTVGALLDAHSVHPGRSPLRLLTALAMTHGIPLARVHEVIELTGLGSVAQKPAGKFSLGMKQRLGLAAAILGDPQVLVLDEPVNGLDPDGVRWIREFVRGFAAQGRTVLLSSHLMSEMQQTADHLLIIGRGRLIADAPMSELLATSAAAEVRVLTSETVRLGELMRADGARSTQRAETNELLLQGTSAQRVGEIAARHGIALMGLGMTQPSLEDTYHQLTRGEVQYVAGSHLAAVAPAASEQHTA